MMKSFKIGKFGIGFAWLNKNFHGAHGSTLRFTVRTYRLVSGRRVTFYTFIGRFLELDAYWMESGLR